MTRIEMRAGAVVAAALCCSPASAGLKFVGARVAASPISLSAVYGIALSPDGKNLYATSENTGAVVVFSRDPASGKLDFLERQVNGVGGVAGLGGAWGVHVSADGKNVYVAGANSALAVFSRNPTTGALTFMEAQQNGIGGVAGLGGARGVGVSADGKNVYVAGYGDSALAVFNRNPTTGALSFLEMHKQGVGAVAGLASPEGLRASADGHHVYVASYDGIAVFTRNLTTGALTFVTHSTSSTVLGSNFDPAKVAAGNLAGGGWAAALPSLHTFTYFSPVPPFNDDVVTLAITCQ